MLSLVLHKVTTEFETGNKFTGFCDVICGGNPCLSFLLRSIYYKYKYTFWKQRSLGEIGASSWFYYKEIFQVLTIYAYQAPRVFSWVLRARY